MTTFLRHVSTIYANLTALYSIGQSVQVNNFFMKKGGGGPGGGYLSQRFPKLCSQRWLENLNKKVTWRLPVCLYVPKNLPNRRTYVVLIYNVPSHRNWGGL